MQSEHPSRYVEAGCRLPGNINSFLPLENETRFHLFSLQSTKFDGKMTSWYHFDCFFERQRPKSVGDIEHFDMLRWEDQEKIQKKIESKMKFTLNKIGQCQNVCLDAVGLAASGAVAVPAKKGRGKAAKGKDQPAYTLQDYTIEYAKSGRAACRSCLEKIPKVIHLFDIKEYLAKAKF